MDLTNEQALQQAVEAHKAGKLQEAEALYRAILQAQPKHPDANHNLGVLAVSLNKSELAVPLFKTALEANPNQGQFWLSYIDALIKTNQLEIAESVLEQGKKLGLAGERVDALEVQLTPLAVVEESESILQKQPSAFTQQRKKESAEKESETSHKKPCFFNSEFGANNVLKLNFPKSVYLEIKNIIESNGFDGLWKVSPNWQSDICWLSPNTLNEFYLFSEIFNSLNIKNLVKEALMLDFNLILYCGFLVRRSKCIDADFHNDWIDTNLKAFTLITPLVEEADDLGLLYIKNDASIGKYFYKPGEAIIFADSFLHSSMPTDLEKEIILLSFTFGIDDMSVWPLIEKYAQSQSNLIRLPNGDFRVRNFGRALGHP
jgi:tetratricopeptide (TPR) repeat protein